MLLAEHYKLKEFCVTLVCFYLLPYQFRSCGTEEAKYSSVTQFSITLAPMWNTEGEWELK